jgi:hypothetical protein
MYTSDINPQGDGILAAQVAGDDLKHTADADGPMTRPEIEAVFAHVL